MPDEPSPLSPSRPLVLWNEGGTYVQLEVEVAQLRAPEHRGLERWIDEWKSADPRAESDGSSLRFSLMYDRWAGAGRPPPSGAEAEELDLFRARHVALSRLLRIEGQHLRLESIGHVGAPDLAFALFIDGAEVTDYDDAKPFFSGRRGRRAMMPCTFLVYEELRRVRANGLRRRAAQLAFLAELRGLLERSAELLGESEAPFSFELDEHLSQFRAHRVERASLQWKGDARGRVFNLEVEHEGQDGEKRPIDLRSLDDEAPILSLSATEHVFLDPEVERVARVAKQQRNKLRKHVEPHFANPATLFPEGSSLEGIDLSVYSPRVTGFAPIVRAERDLDIQSSGVQWYTEDGQRGDEPFLRLFIAQPGDGGISVVELPTPEAADAAIERLEQAVARRSENRTAGAAAGGDSGDSGDTVDIVDIVDIGGQQVAPSAPLLHRLRKEVADFRAVQEKRAAPAAAAEADASGEPAAESAVESASGRLAAIIADPAAPAVAGRAGDAAAAVPWPALEALLAPGIALKPHQRRCVEWLWGHAQRGEPGALVADDMGLGKTLQIAAFLALSRAVSTAPPVERRPSLIVCPVILLENWRDELAKFFRPDVFVSLVMLYGDELARRKRGGGLDVAGLASVSYVLTNYETLQAHQQSLLTLDWDVVVLDEAQAIKNADTYRARAARGLKRRFGICSTGTPVENRLGDLWSLYDFMRPGRPFTTLSQFQRDFETDEQEGIPKLRAALSFPGAGSSLLRRTKHEVLDLPAKTIVAHPVAMTPQQVALERQIAARGKQHGKILLTLQELQKLYQHPQLLVPDGERKRAVAPEVLLAESPKLALCLKLLREIRARGEKALLFTLWVEMQDLLAQVLCHELDLPRVRVINGEPAQRRLAKQAIDELTNTRGFGLLILSPLAAGTGLTITAANHVIHYGRWWNPAKEDQATDRAYRIGQTKPVQVHYPLLHHPGQESAGFDMALHGLVESKRGLARDFLAPHAEDAVTMMDLEQVGRDWV